MKEHFTLAASKNVLQLIDLAASQAGLSRGQTFEDFLTFVRCSLAGHTMEEEYLQTVAKGYAKGNVGHRGIDYICQAFAELVQAMTESGQDVLGDIFTGGITYGERGQFFTPDAITNLMAQLLIPNSAVATEHVAAAYQPATAVAICQLTSRKFSVLSLGQLLDTLVAPFRLWAKTRIF